MLLEIEGLCVNYGHIEAIRDISFGVPEGTVTTLIGANGAGKTTTLKTVSGLRKVRAGSIKFEGKDITDVAPYNRVKLGIGQSPEGRRCFIGMTVRENLEMGAYIRSDANIEEDMGKVFQLFPILKDRLQQLAGTLSGGEQQMLAIGRALMSKPRLLLLDEPSLGLAPLIVKQIFSIIRDIRGLGLAVLLVEQNARQALKVADRAYVFEVGRVVLSGPAAELSSNADVQKAYLGL